MSIDKAYDEHEYYKLADERAEMQAAIKGLYEILYNLHNNFIHLSGENYPQAERDRAEFILNNTKKWSE